MGDFKKLGDSLNRIKENAKRRREKFEEEHRKAKNRKQEAERKGNSKAAKYLDEMRDKYQDQIEGLQNPSKKFWRNMSTRQKAKTIYLLEDITSYEFFQDSQPAIDLAYMIITVKNHGFKKIKVNIDKAYEWLSANPKKRKKNYRRFLTNWLKSENGNVQIVINKDSDDNY